VPTATLTCPRPSRRVASDRAGRRSLWRQGRGAARRTWRLGHAHAGGWVTSCSTRRPRASSTASSCARSDVAPGLTSGGIRLVRRAPRVPRGPDRSQGSRSGRRRDHPWRPGSIWMGQTGPSIAPRAGERRGHDWPAMRSRRLGSTRSRCVDPRPIRRACGGWRWRGGAGAIRPCRASASSKSCFPGAPSSARPS
jgi:hypothetical protein